MSDPTIFRNPSPPPPPEVACPPVKEVEEKTESSKITKKNSPLQVGKFSNVSPSYSKLQSGMLSLEKSESAKVSEKKTPSTVPSKEKIEKPPATASKKSDEKRSSATSRKKAPSDYSDDDDDDDEWRKEFLPDRSKADYYCDICDAHMNSEQMWENHVQGKRHLKNLKKEPGEPISKLRSVKQDRKPELLDALFKVTSPIVGLDFLSELQRCEPHLGPSYNCFLCHATCTSKSVIDHLLGCKHRLAYLKEVSPDEYALVENLNLKKDALTSLAEEYAQRLEKQRGRGKIEVKLEKPKMAPPAPRREKRYMDDDVDDDYYSKRPNIRPHGDWRREYDRDAWSPDTCMPPMPHIPPMYPTMSSMSSVLSSVRGWQMPEKLELLHQLSFIAVNSENEAKALMRIINTLTQSLLQFKIRNLPPGIQDMLAKHIISGDTRSLENALGLGGSGVANVGNVLNSMATAGELSGRSSSGGPDIGGGWGFQPLRNSPGMPMRSSEMWPGPGHSRGMNSPPRAGPHWHGGMANDGHRRGDRSSLGC